MHISLKNLIDSVIVTEKVSITAGLTIIDVKCWGKSSDKSVMFRHH